MQLLLPYAALLLTVIAAAMLGPEHRLSLDQSHVMCDVSPVVCILQAELDMSGWPRNWQAAVQRVLETVLKLPEAALFAEPVPLDEVPGYRELIPNPMDLGTVLGRARADAYDTPLEALADVRQVGNLGDTM